MSSARESSVFASPLMTHPAGATLVENLEQILCSPRSYRITVGYDWMLRAYYLPRKSGDKLFLHPWFARR